MNRGQNSVPQLVADKAMQARTGEPACDSLGRADSDSEVENAVRPMLEAVVRMAGAAAGAIRLADSDATRLRPGMSFGVPLDVDSVGRCAFAFWCGQCPESRNPDSDCVRDRVCGAGDGSRAERTGQVCRYIVSVPLRDRGAQVGTLDLHFDEECELPVQTMPLLRATGELIGVALENARLTRENLHANLTCERQMMANEVHDSLAQGLTYMRMRMSMLRDAIKRGDELGAVKYWGDVDTSLTNAHGRLRELITYFRASMDPQGLQHALAEIARTFFNRTGIALEFVNRAPDLHLPVGREVQAYHIVQEALANVCSHARADRVTLSLDRNGGFCEIAVADDGVGMPTGAGTVDPGDAGHYGMAIMCERTRRLGGELTIERAPGTGTCVRLRFPLVQPQTEGRT